MLATIKINTGEDRSALRHMQSVMFSTSEKRHMAASTVEGGKATIITGPHTLTSYS